MALSLDLLGKIDQLPPDTTAIIDNGRVYGIAVLHLAGGQIRIDVIEMGFNWRVVETELPEAYGYRRFWCFPKSMPVQEVVDAIRKWGGKEDSEPSGWIKTHSWGRKPLREVYGGRLAEEHLALMGKVARKLKMVPA